jgi:hypothetical protein
MRKLSAIFALAAIGMIFASCMSIPMPTSAVEPGMPLDPAKHYLLMRFDGPSLITVKDIEGEFIPYPMVAKRERPGATAMLIRDIANVESGTTLEYEQMEAIHVVFGEYVLFELPPDNYSIVGFFSVLSKDGNLTSQMSPQDNLSFDINPGNQITYVGDLIFFNADTNEFGQRGNMMIKIVDNSSAAQEYVANNFPMSVGKFASEIIPVAESRVESNATQTIYTLY